MRYGKKNVNRDERNGPGRTMTVGKCIKNTTFGDVTVSSLLIAATRDMK